MRESIRLGRIAGISVGINWSLLAIFLLLAVSLSGGRLPDAHPGQSNVTYVAAGVTAAIFFFMSVLLHEVSHAVVARRNGIEVDGIVLWIFGGVARLKGDADNPGAALRIAAVGPLVSLVLGLVFLGIGGLYDPVGTQGVVREAALWLGAINIVLAVFNMFPGAPLDGGRVLRAVLWHFSGDKERSWVQAARAGRVVGYVVIGFGVLQFAAFGVGGLWLVLIGWFLLAAAKVEEAHAELRSSLGDLPVGQVMTRDPVVAPAGASVEEFLEHYVFRHRFSTFPLVDHDGRPTGLATVNQVKAVPADRRASVPVAEVATPLESLAIAHPDEPVAEALERVGADGDGRVLVLEGGRVTGIVSPVDVMRAMELASLRRSAHRAVTG